MASTPKDVYLVIGGSGFLGRHIVNALLARGDSVSVFDVVQRYHDVPFYSGDITEQVSISDALRKVCVDTVMFSWWALLKSFF
jgi:sterol-4alpha-carboxylate 3-dehydrogenase (decarboxylating)